MDRPLDRGPGRSWAAIAALAILFAAGASAVGAGDQAPSQTPGDRAPGMVIYRDPITGQVVPPPAGVPAGVPGAAVTAPPPLVERPGTTRGGGYLADLQGRGTKTMAATVDPEGTVHVDCVPAAQGRDR